MNKRTYLEIGLKLLGVYAAILGATSLAGAFVGLFLSWPGKLTAAQIGSLLLAKVLRFVSPIVYLALAYFLTRKTSICVRWCLAEDKDDTRQGRNSNQ